MKIQLVQQDYRRQLETGDWSDDGITIEFPHWGKEPDQAAIGVPGCGEYNSPDGEGFPVLIEMREDGPYLIVWADINQENPTHVIPLAGALESNRKEEN